MKKFNRRYLFSIQKADGNQLDIKLPFTLEFEVSRNILSSLNTASFSIYNLKQSNRDQVRKNSIDYGVFRSVQLKAGYEDNLPIIFLGNVSQAWSMREGTNFITHVECFDGGFAFSNGNVSKTYQSGTPQKTIIQDMISTTLPGVTLGKVGTYEGSISRGNSYSGSPSQILYELGGGGFFIDNGKGNCLKDNECLRGDIATINSESGGLLGTPLLESTYLHFDMIFEPRLQIGQKILLESSTLKEFNGEKKIVSIKHRGTISEAVCGDAITSVSVWAGTSSLVVIP